jgi:hypothetical protein
MRAEKLAADRNARRGSKDLATRRNASRIGLCLVVVAFFWVGATAAQVVHDHRTESGTGTWQPSPSPPPPTPHPPPEPTPPPSSGELVTHTVKGRNTETWRIDQPNVKQHITEYPQIRFQPRDRITIDAGGCVQTGGLGPTWKLYVHPSGGDADRLFHGLIWIPRVIGGPAGTGVPPTPERITGHIGPNEAVTVPAGGDVQQLYLRLGYEDDGYGDNGYQSHDDGTQNQCHRVGNAFVTLTIVHNSSDVLPPPPPAPFDLLWDSEDDNGFPLNPFWGWQVTHPGAFPDPAQCTDGPFSGACTSWADVITQDTANVCNIEQYEPGKSNSPPLFGIAGHVNWAAATYVGRMTWESHSTPGTDDDYNFDFYPVNGAGLTSTRNNLEVEFDTDETIDHFKTPWWNTLHHAVDNSSDAAVNDALFKEPDGAMGRYAIVTGLVGLEMCHAGDTELHPAWAVAIRVKDDNPADEVWAMFVRRNGNEGYCSSNQHYVTDLPNNTYTFRLPWRPGATGVSVGSATTFLSASSGASGPSVQPAPNQGMLVSFTLPAPQFVSGRCVNCNRINGEIHLNWQGGQGPAPIPRSNAPGGVVAHLLPLGGPVSPRETEEKGSPEGRLAAILTEAPSSKRKKYLAAFPKKKPAAPDVQHLTAGAVVPIAALPRKVARAKHRQYESVADPAKTRQNQRSLDALRKLTTQ